MRDGGCLTRDGGCPSRKVRCPLSRKIKRIFTGERFFPLTWSKQGLCLRCRTRAVLAMAWPNYLRISAHNLSINDVVHRRLYGGSESRDLEFGGITQRGIHPTPRVPFIILNCFQ
jgi:hypothetical protein